jgi:signal transduction histidine kinase
MKFRYKILLSIWGVVLSLLVITFFVLNNWTRSRVEETFTQELTNNRSTLNGIVGLEAELLSRGCQVIAESPRLRAVVELHDASTAEQLSRELNQTALGDLFVLTDSSGNSMVELVGDQNERGEVGYRSSIRRALLGRSATDVWTVDGRVYRVASVPLRIDFDVVGTLTLGFRITTDELARLKQWTNRSEILLARRQEILLSTLEQNDQRELAASFAAEGILKQHPAKDSSGAVFRVKVAQDVYLGTTYRLSESDPTEGPVEYCVVKSTNKELSRALNPILGAFGIVSLIFLALTTIIGHVISGGITRPIQALVQATSEISKGNYDYAIVVSGKDEVSFLAQRFGEMSKSLKEKITELGRLNRDLIGRNSELDETLQRLKQAQEELVKSERLAATGKLTAQLAHEINNPIHNIQSCLKTSLGRLPGEIPGRELIEVAYEEVTRMSRLTRQLLDFYRTAIVAAEVIPVDLNEVLRDVLNASGDSLKTARIAVQSTLDEQMPRVQGSPDKLKQVFLNLVLNAKDAMPLGGNLTVTSECIDGCARIAFKDTGIGIPRENIDKIFDAFFTTKSKVSGVGLGLSVSYGIISQHRGTISVASSPGQGATFVVSLPISNGDSRAAS